MSGLAPVSALLALPPGPDVLASGDPADGLPGLASGAELRTSGAFALARAVLGLGSGGIPVVSAPCTGLSEPREAVGPAEAAAVVEPGEAVEAGEAAAVVEPGEAVGPAVALVARGVVFVRPPTDEPYGVVAVFEDLYGNLFDLIERKRGV
jgi:hypothetical protein